MEWSEPSLIEYEFRHGAAGHQGLARLGFPRPDQDHRDEWICSCQISSFKDGRICTARGEDGLQALTIASDVIRKSLDRLTDVSSDRAPYEIVFPRYLPFCCGLEFHRKLCRIVDLEIEKKGRQGAVRSKKSGDETRFGRRKSS
jgi:hypothetical protein